MFLYISHITLYGWYPMHALKSMWVRTHWEFQCDDLTKQYLVDFQNSDAVSLKKV